MQLRATAFILVLVKIDDESISDPQKIMRTLQLNAREFLQLVAAQSMHAHRVVEVTHRDERLLPHFTKDLHVDAVEVRNARAALNTKQLNIRGDNYKQGPRLSADVKKHNFEF